jgi:hypothetical protein
MGKEASLKNRLFQDIVNFARVNHPDVIDKAYEYFWDKENPDEFLSGAALSLGFHNFEDWLVFDYRISDKNETLIDLFITSRQDLEGDAKALLLRMKDSVFSLYEVESVAKDKHVKLRDVLLNKDADLRERELTRGLKKGDLFAARLLDLDGKKVMSGSVFPYLPAQKKQVLAYIDRQFSRYIRNVDPKGTMKGYLKGYGDVFNIIWMNFILEPPAGRE